MEQQTYTTGMKPIRLREEAYLTHWIRLAAEALTDGSTHFICNDSQLKRPLTTERQAALMLELISREPRPFVEYLESGCLHLRRTEIIGDGTKKSPYKAQWRNDYYKY